MPGFGHRSGAAGFSKETTFANKQNYIRKTKTKRLALVQATAWAAING